MLCCGRVCLGTGGRGVVGGFRAVQHVQIMTVTTRDAKPLWTLFRPTLWHAATQFPCVLLMFVPAGRLKTIVLDMDNTLLVAGDDHDTVSLTFQPYLGEFLAMLLGPQASREDTYRPSKPLETGRSGQALWSMIQEVKRYSCVVL